MGFEDHIRTIEGLVKEEKPAIHTFREPLQNIEAIAWDLDDTLCPTTRIVSELRIAAVTAMLNRARYGSLVGPDVSVESAYEVLKGIIRRKGSNAKDHYNALWNNLGVFDEPKRNYYPNRELSCIGFMTYHRMKESLFAPSQKIHEILGAVESKGIPQVLLTSGIPEKQHEKIERLGMNVFFGSDRRRILDESELNKSRAMSVLAVDLKRPATSIAAVGDRYDSEIESANRAGLISVYYYNPEGGYAGILPQNELQIPNYWMNDISLVLELIR